ncbi:MAG: ABC transporter permease [Oscillospiraceae bacterium]
MTAFFLSLKRLIFSKGFIFSLLILPILLCGVSLGFKLSDDKSISKACIYFEDPDTAVFFENLINEGNFESVSSYSELEDTVSSGKYDCGFKISPDFENMLTNVRLDGSIEVISTERSEMVPFFTQEITVYTADISVPYISAKILNSSGETSLSYDELLNETTEKYLVSIKEESVLFEYKYISGKKTETENTLYLSVIKGLVAIILLVFCILSTEEISSESVKSVSKRLSPKSSVMNIFLPYSLSYTVCAVLSSVVGIIIANAILPFGINIFEFILYIVIYTLLLLGISLILSALSINNSILNALIAPLITVSAVLCPIFNDIRNQNTILKIISFICPPCYLFGYSENPLLYISLSIMILLSGILLICLSSVKSNVRNK